MIEIAKAVQEGAAAYLSRQFKTLAVFAALVFLLLFLLPADTTAVDYWTAWRPPAPGDEEELRRIVGKKD